MVFLFAILSSIAGQAPNTETIDGIAIGKRVVAAIKGETEFQDTDFSKPLRQTDKDALRRLGNCKLERIMYRTNAYPKLVSGSVADPNVVRVVYACKGVPWSSPASLSLHLKEGRIASVETHNLDLVRAD